MMRIDSNLANKPKPTLAYGVICAILVLWLNGLSLLVDSSLFNISLRFLIMYPSSY